MPRRLLRILPIAMSLSLAHTALADPDDEQKAAARMLGTEGVRLALSGDCANAVDKLTRAEALIHAPTTALPLARCQIQLGRIVAGTEILNRMIHETLPPNAPRSWVDAKKGAQGLLDTAEPRIARLRIHVEGLSGTTPNTPNTPNPKVAVDGETVPAVLLDNDRPTDPGTHHITAEAEGFIPATADVSLAEGETVSLRLVLQLGAVESSKAPAAVQPSRVAVQPSPVAPSRSRAPAYVLLGAGAAGVVAGSVFGILALTTKSKLDSECSSKICGAASQGDIDALHLDALVSTIGFGLGLVGVALGTYFLVTSHDETGPKTAGIFVRPWVGAGSAGLAGSFQ